MTRFQERSIEPQKNPNPMVERYREIRKESPPSLKDGGLKKEKRAIKYCTTGNFEVLGEKKAEKRKKGCLGQGVLGKSSGYGIKREKRRKNAK